MLKEKKLLLTFLIVLPILMPIFCWTSTNVKGQPGTKIYVNPARSTAKPGEGFTINLKIAGVKDLYSYEVYLRWDPKMLNVVKVTEGPFLNAEKNYQTFFQPKTNFPTAGHLYVVCTLQGEPPTAAATGDGILASVDFEVLNSGKSTLELYGTKLVDYEHAGVPEYTMPHTTEDGFFKYPVSKIRVDPPSITDPSLLPGNTFNINISISEAEEIYAWSLNMSWDPALLNITEIKEGPFLNGNEDYNTTFTPDINQEGGYVYVNCTLSDEPANASASDNGTLALITFLVEGRGGTALHFVDAILLDYEGVEVLSLTEDGYFSSLLRNVAIISLEVSPNETKAGDFVSISVVAKNKGTITFGRSIDVTFYSNDSFIGTLGIPDLDPDAEKMSTFSWSTKDLTEGNYVIKAVASQLPGEVDIDDNTYFYEYFMVTMPEQPFPFVLTAAIATVIVATAIGFVLLKKRR